MTFLLIYLAIGLVNYGLFAARGNALLFNRPKRRDGDARAAGMAEAVFFILAWPAQATFWLMVKAHAGLDLALGRMFR